MNGKITMSRSGSTGRTSGILTGASSLRRSSVTWSSPAALLASILRPLYGNHGTLAAAVLQPRQGDGQQACRQPGLGLPQVHRALDRDRARETPLGPLQAQEGGVGHPALAPLAADHEL